MRKQIILRFLGLFFLAAAAAQAQAQGGESPEDGAIRKSIEEYCTAFNEGKLEAILGYWSEDANYVDGAGNAHQGKEAIGKLFTSALANLEGSTLALKIDHLQFAKPEVAIEDGIATVTGPDGESSSGRYTAVWVKENDRWRIKSAHDLSTEEQPVESSNADYLQPLQWLIGDWTSDDNGRTVRLNAKWALDRNYIVQNYVVSGEGSDDLRVMQLIGFDPISGQIKSWTFDSLGGYGEGHWYRDGNAWTSESTGVLPDGRLGSALNSVRFEDENHFEWRSADRNVEGQPMADTVVSFVRGDQAVDENDR